MKIEIESISILTQGSGTDEIVLYPKDLPDGCWPFTDKSTLVMTVVKGGAVEYRRKHFPGVPTKIINMRTGTIAEE